MSSRLNAIASITAMCISIVFIMAGMHNIDNAVNMAIVEDTFCVYGVDRGLVLSFDKQTLYMVGGSLVIFGVVVLAPSGIYTGYNLRGLKECE